MDIQTLEREMLSLPISARAELAHELLESLDSLGPEEIHDQWLDEAERRLKEHDAGFTKAVSVEEAF